MTRYMLHPYQSHLGDVPCFEACEVVRIYLDPYNEDTKADVYVDDGITAGWIVVDDGQDASWHVVDEQTVIKLSLLGQIVRVHRKPGLDNLTEGERT